MRTHFEINPGKHGQLYVTLVATNGLTLTVSEGYNDVRDARHVIHLIKRTTEKTPVIDRSTSNPEEALP